MKTKELNLNKAKYNQDIAYLKKYLLENNLSSDYYDKCLKELAKNRPIQYIIGNVNFYGNIINVNESVLIPRFETELLVDKTIQKVKQLFPNKNLDIIDLGTGSGCIAITLKKELNAQVSALDISIDALKVAKQNAKNNQVSINFIHADMDAYQKGRFDVIIANPPYISYEEEIMDLVKYNEPNLALYAENHGLYHYQKILENVKYLTKDKYLIAFEIGETQSSNIENIAKQNLKNINISIEKDYSGKDRFIFITNINI